jgi:hypothetical protein
MLPQDAHKQDRVDKLVGVRCCDDDDGVAFGNPPYASWVDFSEEDLEAGGEDMEQKIVDPWDQASAFEELALHYVECVCL